MAHELEVLNKYTRNESIISYVSKRKSYVNDVNSIFLNLNRTNRKQNQKDELVLMYLGYAEEFNKDEMKSLVCHSLITNVLTYSKQKKAINEYIAGEKNMQDIIRECYEEFGVLEAKPKQIIKKKTSKH